MGCTTSTPEGGKGKKGKKGKKGSKDKDKTPHGVKKFKSKADKITDEDDDDDVAVISDKKPEVLRKEIAKIAKDIAEKRDKSKASTHLLLNEKRGLEIILEKERNKLAKLAEQKTALEFERSELMLACWNADADDLYRAFEKREKKEYVLILTTRTNWQLQEIGKMFESKYGESLQTRLVTDGQRVLGKLFTGSLSYLTKLLTYRVMPQAERDAAFLKDFTSGMSIQDEELLEIVMTLSNSELLATQEKFVNEYGVPLSDSLKGHSYKNYRDFMERVLECKRDEFGDPFDDETATKLAAEVYAAGAGRTIGIDAEVFIRVFSTISKPQFDSLNAKYKNQQLLKDIDAKLGGDFAQAIKIRCSDRYEYLAGRLALALKSSFSADKESVCRCEREVLNIMYCIGMLI
jgi:hypothetical protein